MKRYSIKVQQPGEVLKKDEQLAWRIASMAYQEWGLTNAITEMVGNRIIDNAGVAILSLIHI